MALQSRTVNIVVEYLEGDPLKCCHILEMGNATDLMDLTFQNQHVKPLILSSKKVDFRHLCY